MLRLSVITTVFLKELRELSRDRRSLMVMLGVPLVVYPLLFAGIGALAKGKAEQQRTHLSKVLVIGATNAPELLRRLRLEDNHLNVVPDPPAAETTDAVLQSGKTEAILTIPPAAESHLLHDPPKPGPPHNETSEFPTTSTQPANPHAFTIRVDRSHGDSDATESRLRAILAGYERWILEQRLATRGLSPDILSPIPKTTIDIATKDQRLGRFLAQLLPLLLLITGMLGAFFPALNATTTERELGTLETLLVSPVSREELLLAKGALVLCCSILTALLNLISMSVVFAQIAASAKDALGTVALNPSALALAFVSTIPALVLFSAIVMCVGMIARNYREANSFAAPVMMLPMAAMAIGMADPVTTKALLATPIANTTILIRDILTSRFTWPNFALAAAANLTFATAVLSVAARLFTNEQLVNPSWEPISLKGFKRHKGVKRAPRLPTVDEALILLAVAILLQFYGGPHLLGLHTSGKIDVLTFIALTLTTSFLLPALLLAFIANYDWKAVFSLRMPKPVYVIAGILAGLGLMPLAMAYGQLQAYLFPSEPSDAAQNLMQLLGQGFQINPWLAAAVFGIVPGICEELVFRGILLSSLRKRLNIHAAIWITGLLFALTHLDAAGLVPRTILGAALGYLTVYSGSIFPAMLLHACFNASQISLIAWYAPSAFSSTPISTTQPSAEIPEALKPLSLASLTRIVVGFVCMVLAMLLTKLSAKGRHLDSLAVGRR